MQCTPKRNEKTRIGQRKDVLQQIVEIEVEIQNQIETVGEKPKDLNPPHGLGMSRNRCREIGVADDG